MTRMGSRLAWRRGSRGVNRETAAPGRRCAAPLLSRSSIRVHTRSAARGYFIGQGALCERRAACVTVPASPLKKNKQPKYIYLYRMVIQKEEWRREEVKCNPCRQRSEYPHRWRRCSLRPRHLLFLLVPLLRPKQTELRRSDRSPGPWTQRAFSLFSSDVYVAHDTFFFLYLCMSSKCCKDATPLRCLLSGPRQLTHWSNSASRLCPAGSCIANELGGDSGGKGGAKTPSKNK